MVLTQKATFAYARLCQNFIFSGPFLSVSRDQIDPRRSLLHL